MDGGTLRTARNPAASLVIRIKNARKQCGSVYEGSASKGGKATNWKSACGAKSFRKGGITASPEIMYDPVENFLTENGIIGDPAADDLRGCPPDVQQLVMEKGSLLTARNPAASLVIRIKNAREQCGKGSSKGPAKGKKGSSKGGGRGS